MFDFLEKLRHKPDKQKKQIAFFVAFLFVGIIFVVWLTVIYPDFRQSRVNQEKVANLEPGPFSTFTSQLSNGISSITEDLSRVSIFGKAVLYLYIFDYSIRKMKLDRKSVV